MPSHFARCCLVALGFVAACSTGSDLTGPETRIVAAKAGKNVLPSLDNPHARKIVVCGQDYPADRCHDTHILRTLGDEEGLYTQAAFYIYMLSEFRLTRPTHLPGGGTSFANSVWVIFTQYPAGEQLPPGVHTYPLPVEGSSQYYVEILIEPGVAIGPWAEDDGFGGIRDFGIFKKTD